MARRVQPPSIGNDTCSGLWLNNSGNFTHKWRLHKLSFDYQYHSECVLNSSTFSPVMNDKIKWHLEISSHITVDKPYCVKQYNHTLAAPQSTSGEASYVPNNGPDKGIYLYCTTSYGSNVKANIEISAIDDAGAKICPKVMKNHEFTWYNTKCKLLQPSDYVQRSLQTIICEINFVEDAVKIPELSQPIRVESLKSGISKDFEQLFISQDFSDITLTVGDKDIPAHKMVLAARSPVFLEMFKDNTKDLKTNVVAINDIDHEVVLEMLRFIYTDEAPNLNKIASKLLVAAEKYGIDRLKVMCAEALQQSLNVENALDNWVLSHLHNEDQLKNVAVKFICQNIKNMIETTSFQSLAALYSNFGLEIMRELSTKWN